ncbi:hypothetical protein ABEG63_04260 [Chryseobacterium sp. C39-AII1]|uniref:hypothetical protein n=1 Tax=Chryseobacterium sp. C39-AII1 TaxID=3080332 RepID=UPI00320B508E
MPTLNEYLGGIVSEITAARKMADMQTVEIAKEYAKDDLLKHFSIPRMKVGTVDLTVPFAKAAPSPILSFTEFAYAEIIKVAQTDYNPSDAKSDKSLKDFLVDLQVYYKNGLEKARIDKVTVFTEAHMAYFDVIPGYTAEFCETLPNFSWKLIKPETLKEKMYQRIFKEAKKTIENKPDNDYEVIVEASKLMELDPKCLIVAKMSVTESGMEWSKYEDIDGNIIETLIPE